MTKLRDQHIKRLSNYLIICPGYNLLVNVLAGLVKHLEFVE